MLLACLFVFTACLFVIWLVCYGFRACHNTSTTGHAKNVPDPTSCRDVHYTLSVSVPSCWGFHNQLSIFAFSHDSVTFTTDPRVGYRVGSSGTPALEKRFK